MCNVMDICFLCYKNRTDLRPVNESYIKNVIYKKLTDCIPEFVSYINLFFKLDYINVIMVLIVQDSDCFESAMICVECINYIENMHCFRTMCLFNRTKFLNYINQLHSISDAAKVNLDKGIGDCEDLTIKTENEENEFNDETTETSSENVLRERKMETDNYESRFSVYTL